MKTPDGWRFKSRQCIPRKIGVPPPTAKLPPSLAEVRLVRHGAICETRCGTRSSPGRGGRPAGDRRWRRRSGAESGAAAGVMALTAMDYIQIKQLVNRYAFALDTGSRNGYDYADLFAPDGVFDSNTRGRTQGPRPAGGTGPRREAGPAPRQPLHLRTPSSSRRPPARSAGST